MDIFPPLPLAGWRHTREALQVYARLLSNIRQVMAPPQRYGWKNAGLAVSAGGLTTTPIAVDGFVFEMKLHFVAHQLQIEANRGKQRKVPLRGQSAERFCTQVLDELAVLGVVPDIDHTDFADEQPGMYDETAVSTMWQAFTQIDAVFKQFQGNIRGQTSPVQLVQPFNLTVQWLTEVLTHTEAVVERQMTFGFSPGDSTIADPYFYATIIPMPERLAERPLPPHSYWQTEGISGAVMLYDQLRVNNDPQATLLQFLQAAYEAGAKTILRQQHEF